MDSLTQAALGAAVAEVGLSRKLGTRGVVFGALCGLAPDLDYVVRVFGPWCALIHHRGLTHSLLFLAVVALTLRVQSFANAQLESEGFEPVAVRATPTILLGSVRRVVARDEAGRLRVANASPFSSRPLEFRSYTSADDERVRMALQRYWGKTFCWFANEMVWAQTERRSGDVHVLLSDLRYGLISRPDLTPFKARLRIGPADEVLSAELVWEMRDVDIGEEWAASWAVLLGN